MDNQVCQQQENQISKWATARLIIGVVCITTFPLISFQSCAAGLGNMISGNDEVSGFAGTFTALFLLISGIVMIATRKSVKKGASITCCVLLWIGFFFSRVLSGSYGDLKIWGMLAFFFGAFFLITAMQSKKGIGIALAISIVYFALGIA